MSNLLHFRQACPALLNHVNTAGDTHNAGSFRCLRIGVMCAELILVPTASVSLGFRGSRYVLHVQANVFVFALHCEAPLVSCLFPWAKHHSTGRGVF